MERNIYDDPLYLLEEEEEENDIFQPEPIEPAPVPEVSESVAKQTSNALLNIYDEPQYWEGGTSVAPGTIRDYIANTYGDEGLNEADILNDPILMNAVRTNLKTRFEDRNMLQSAATALTGGAYQGYVDGLSDKEVLDRWQNYQRSFSAGQTVTTVNEFAYARDADEARQAILKDGYDLFDSMGHIYTRGDGFWEAADATWDYVKNSVWDPSTLVSFGVGRAYAAGGAKAASQALRQSATLAGKQIATAAQKKAATEAIMASAKAAGKPLTKAAAKKLGAEAAEKAAQAAAQRAALEAGEFVSKKAVADLGKKATIAMGATDLVASVGADVAYQMTQMEVGSQEEYSKLQTAAAGLGLAVAPALVYGGKGIAKAIRKGAKSIKSLPGFEKATQNYNGIIEATWGKSYEDVIQAVKDKVDATKLSDGVKRAMENFRNHPHIAWGESKARVRDLLSGEGISVNNMDAPEAFFRVILYGNGYENVGKEGLVSELTNAGFAYAPRFDDDVISNWVGDLLSWLPEDSLRKAVLDFEEIYGAKLPFDVDADNLAMQIGGYWKLSRSEMGRGLGFASQLKKDFAGNVGANEFIDSMVSEATGNGLKTQKNIRQTLNYMMSVWKRAMTSNPATTMANLRGWSVTYNMNTLSDIVLGVGEMLSDPLGHNKGSLLNPSTFDRGYQTLLSAGRRSMNLVDPSANSNEMSILLDTLAGKKWKKELTRDLAGDVGVNDAPNVYNMNPNHWGVKTVEYLTQGAQKWTGVRLQDEITKMMSLGPALDREIARRYGMSYTDFMNYFGKDNALSEMMKPKFQDALAAATNRVKIETGSKSYSVGVARSLSRGIATNLEHLSTRTPFGFAVPFGRFFNTTMELTGNYTGINFIRHYTKQVTGGIVDPLEEEAGELLSNAVVGWGAILALAPVAEEKIRNGLSWNQHREDTGRVTDFTWDYPLSHAMALAHIVGHMRHEARNAGVDFEWTMDSFREWFETGRKGIPQELGEQVFELGIGQTFRTLDDSFAGAGRMLTDVLSGEFGFAGEQFVQTLLGFTGRIVSGATRPLDWPNTMAQMFERGAWDPDRRQSPFLGQALRYVDSLPGIRDLPYMKDMPQRARPTRTPGTTNADPGKLFMGKRTSPSPNVTERVLASIGRQAWDSIPGGGFEGPPEVKNEMDEAFSSFVNMEMQRMTEMFPNFDEYPLEQRQKWVNQALMIAKEKTKEYVLRNSTSGAGTINKIMGHTRNKVDSAMSALGLDGTDITDLSQAQLDLLLYFLEDYDENMGLIPYK